MDDRNKIDPDKLTRITNLMAHWHISIKRSGIDRRLVAKISF